jgi:hypothetical protein
VDPIELSLADRPVAAWQSCGCASMSDGDLRNIPRFHSVRRPGPDQLAGTEERADSIQYHLPFDAPFDVTDARYGHVLNEKQPSANECDGRFFFHTYLAVRKSASHFSGVIQSKFMTIRF